VGFLKAEIKERIEMISRGEVPKGYKKTKVGIIPEDWEVTRLEEDCNKINVGFVGTCEKYYTNRHEGIPMLRTGNIKDGKIKFDDLKYVTKEFHERNLKSQVNWGDILIARHGSNGEGALYDYDNESNSLNIVIVSPNKDSINTKYLYFQINGSNTKRQVIARTAGSTQGVINTKEIKKIRIIKANSKEQHKIAQILSTWDKAIELKEQLIEKKKEQKKGLMQRLLTGEVRLSGFDGKWEKVRLSKLLDYEQPGKYITDNIKEHIKGSVAVLTANKSFILGFTTDKNGVYTDIPVIIFDDFTTSSKYVDFPFKVKSSAIKILKPKIKEVDLKFVYEMMQIIKFPVGGHKRYYLSEYQYISIKLPNIQEQKAIAQVLSTANKEIELLEEELEQLKLQKKGLMQLLLTGIIRVKS
jgi:type I restriction enzyme S subunit